MRASLFVSLCAIVGLAACGETIMTSETAQDPVLAAISGKTVQAPRGDTVTFGSNGALSGMVGPNQNVALVGAWEIRDGQYCRTISEPASFAGTACQDIKLNDDGTVTIDGTNGPITWTII